MVFQTIIVYVLFIGILVLLGKNVARFQYTRINGTIIQNSVINPSFLTMVFIFALVSGMRYDVGTDYLSYLTDYLNGKEAYFSDHEFLFSSITRIFYDFEVHPLFYFAFWACLQFFLFFYALKDYRFVYPLLIYFLFTNITYLSWMNGIRQDIAACIWIYSLQYVFNKKLLKYLICCFIATLFHRSAVILVIIYPLLINIKWLPSIPYQLLAFAGAYIIRISIGSFITELNTVMTVFSDALVGDKGIYDHYNMSETMYMVNNFKGGSNLGLIAKAVVYASIIISSEKMKNFYNSKYLNMLYVLFFISVITTYITPSGAIYLERPFRYLSNFLPTIFLAFYVYYLYNSKFAKNGKIFAFMVIFLFGALFSYVTISAVADKSPHVAFFLIFQIPESIWGSRIF